MKREKQVRSYLGSFKASDMSGIGSWMRALATVQTDTTGASCTGGIQVGCRSPARYKPVQVVTDRAPGSKSWNLGSRSPVRYNLCWLYGFVPRPGPVPRILGVEFAQQNAGSTDFVWRASASHKMVDPRGGTVYIYIYICISIT